MERLQVKSSDLLHEDEGWCYVPALPLDIKLSASGFKTYNALTFFLRESHPSEMVTVSYKHIATITNLTPATIKLAVKELEERGLIDVVKRNADDGGNLSNGYIVYVPVER